MSIPRLTLVSQTEVLKHYACMNGCKMVTIIYSSIYNKQVTFQSLHLNMTPLWLEEHASFIDSSRFTTADQITFNAGALKNAALLKVALVADGVLTDGTPLTVEITVANNAIIGQTRDSDVRCGLSDGNNFIGFEMPDKSNYDKNAPCYGIQAKSGRSISSQHAIAKKASNSRPSFYPELFFLTFKLDRQWGSCFTAHGGGFNKSIDFSKRLMLSQGLTLEVYKSDKEEKVGIKYIVVSLRKNGHN